MGLQTKVSVAKAGTSSLRTTIPESVASLLELKPGDTLEWSPQMRGGVPVAILSLLSPTRSAGSTSTDWETDRLKAKIAELESYVKQLRGEPASEPPQKLTIGVPVPPVSRVAHRTVEAGQPAFAGVKEHEKVKRFLEKR